MRQPTRSEIVAAVTTILLLWSSLAQIAPRYFQVERIGFVAADLLWVALPIAFGWVFFTLIQIESALAALTGGAESAKPQPSVLSLRTFPAFDDETNVLHVSVTNDGKRDRFVVQIEWVFGTMNFLNLPFTARWETTNDAGYTLAPGETQHVRLFELVLTPDRLRVDHLLFSGPNTSYKLQVRPTQQVNDVYVYDGVEIEIKIIDTAGASHDARFAAVMSLVNQRLKVKVFKLA